MGGWHAKDPKDTTDTSDTFIGKKLLDKDTWVKNHLFGDPKEALM